MDNPAPLIAEEKKRKVVYFRIALYLIALGVFLIIWIQVNYQSSRAVDPESFFSRHFRYWFTSIANAQAEFRNNDQDGNGVNDYWRRDIAGLHALPGKDGNPTLPDAV